MSLHALMQERELSPRMGGIHFTDGIDRPDTIAFGLDAPRLVAVVVAALSGYAVMQAPLPFALRVGVAVLVAATGALLGWGRYAGRPLLTWAWLALRFALSPQTGGGPPVSRGAPVGDSPRDDALATLVQPAAEAREPAGETPAVVEDSLPAWAKWLDFDASAPAPAMETAPAASTAVLPEGTVETSRDVPLVVVVDSPAATATHDDHTDEPAEEPPHASVVHLPFARNDAASVTHATHTADAHDAPPPVFVGAPRRVTFFSLNGGSGRTTLATEVACILAARGRHLTADGTERPLHVALLDLDLRSATVAVRLGIAHPTLGDYLANGADPARLERCLVRHSSGVRALLGPPKPLAAGSGALEPARVAEIVHRLERDGAQFVVVDVSADLGAVTTWVLSAMHDVFVVITPTASGVQDAYRTTEALRRLGLGHKLRYVVNRARSTPDLDEVMGDLGGRVAAVIPYDPAIEEAENHHDLAALTGNGAAARALHDLAALLYPSLAPAARRTRAHRLPWRRRVG
jgi:MinD-like ATPase involved in chromosome partitioning or flagellar assembly